MHAGFENPQQFPCRNRKRKSLVSIYCSGNDGLQRMKRLEQQKLSKDFQVLLARFQQIQRQSAEKSREYVAKAKQQSTQLDQE